MFDTTAFFFFLGKTESSLKNHIFICNTFLKMYVFSKKKLATDRLGKLESVERWAHVS